MTLTVRPLLAVFIIILTLGASGITSAIASSVAVSEDDCCTDGAGDLPNEEGPSGERDKCPPFCHSCACSPTFAVPSMGSIEAIVCEARAEVAPALSSQLPPSPPGRDVFHTSFHDEPITAGATYIYMVVVTNEDGENQSNQATFVAP